MADLLRTPAQRRADAFVEMATRSRTAPPDGRRPEPLFTVLVGYETLHGRIAELEDGTVVPPGTLLAWLAEADVERAEYRSDGTVAVGARAKLETLDATGLERAVATPITRVECNPEDRCFTGATRRAIEIRDRRCCHPTCDLPASWCQVDHVRPYADGGPTTQENGRLLCGPHNRMRNYGRPAATAGRGSEGARMATSQVTAVSHPRCMMPGTWRPSPETPTQEAAPCRSPPFPSRCPASGRASVRRPPQAFTIDCADCTHRHTSVCDDCVVSFIVGRQPEDAVVVDVEEARAVRLLEQAGLVPGVRHARDVG